MYKVETVNLIKATSQLALAFILIFIIDYWAVG